jgi:ribosome maturation factor RimP
MDSELKTQVNDLIEKPLLDRGYELADMVLSRFKGQVTLKLFVYSTNGVTLDGCAQVSRLVGDLIDGTELFVDGYLLEVSSAGLDRPLKTARDFRFRVGETVRLHFSEKGRKKVTAEIVGLDGDLVLFRNDDGPFSVRLDELDEAKIIF